MSVEDAKIEKLDMNWPKIQIEEMESSKHQEPLKMKISDTSRLMLNIDNKSTLAPEFILECILYLNF